LKMEREGKKKNFGNEKKKKENVSERRGGLKGIYETVKGKSNVERGKVKWKK